MASGLLRMHELSHLLPVERTSFGLEDAARRWRMRDQLARWTDRARREITAAIRTDAAELAFDAISAERTLVRADHCVGCRRREILIAAFASRT